MWANSYHATAIDLPLSTRLAPNLVRWSHALTGWITPNIGGAINPSSSLSSTGAVLRSHDGEWLVGFNHLLIFSTVLHDELWGVYESLNLVWSHVFDIVQCQIDSTEAYHLITEPSTFSSPITHVHMIVHSLSRAWFVEFKLIKHELNTVVDFLAKYVAHHDGSTHVVSDISGSLQNCLHHGLYGPLYLRYNSFLM
ncbi:hypothetical protein V6N11_026019 [Hibiscus sabdariffa]|uniref:RNase H type-1 domain-containing protein n=1 Tax=Hibiscus sabdariffa TaxID=183260 RepID=A0ABR2SVA1_9ROSI